MSLRAELRETLTARSFGLVVGIFVLQLAFIWSYVGAFHSPKASDIPVAVVAPAQQASQIAAQLNDLDGHPVAAQLVDSRAAAQEKVKNHSIDAAYVMNTSGKQDTLLVASGGGSGIVTAVEDVFDQFAKQQGRTVSSDDIVPLQSGDARGLTGFYLVIGWMVGGYLVASILGILAGSRAKSLHHIIIRLCSVALYAVLSGLGGALIVDQLLGALTGHFLALWGIGALVVFAAATATIAFQVLFGLIGIGVAILLFVVLGNPSAGGAFQPHLLPGFWRVIAYVLPNGAGTDAVRRVIYFGGHGIGNHLVTLVIWAVIGTAVAVIATAYFARRQPPVVHGRHEAAEDAATA